MPTTHFDSFTPANSLQPYMSPELARMRSVAMVPAGAGTTYTLAKGTVLGQVTASKKFNAYNDALATGLEVARGILQQTITVDENGLITYSSDNNFSALTAPMYYHVTLLSTDLTGMNAAAMADLQASIVEGDLTTGIITF